MELVSLQSPDGRPYKTDSQAEINLLVGTYGYTRVSERSSQRRKSAPKPAAPAEPPSAPSHTNNTESDGS